MRNLWRRLFILSLALLSWAAMVGEALAQRNKAVAEDAGAPSYGFAYAVVILLIVLGLIVVGRPGSRTREVKRPVFEEEEE